MKQNSGFVLNTTSYSQHVICQKKLQIDNTGIGKKYFDDLSVLYISIYKNNKIGCGFKVFNDGSFL